MTAKPTCLANHHVTTAMMQSHGVEHVPDDILALIRDGIEIGPGTGARASHEIERAKRQIKQLGLYGPIIEKGNT